MKLRSLEILLAFGILAFSTNGCTQNMSNIKVCSEKFEDYIYSANYDAVYKADTCFSGDEISGREFFVKRIVDSNGRYKRVGVDVVGGKLIAASSDYLYFLEADQSIHFRSLNGSEVGVVEIGDKREKYSYTGNVYRGDGGFYFSVMIGSSESFIYVSKSNEIRVLNVPDGYYLKFGDNYYSPAILISPSEDKSIAEMRYFQNGSDVFGAKYLSENKVHYFAIQVLQLSSSDGGHVVMTSGTAALARTDDMRGRSVALSQAAKPYEYLDEKRLSIGVNDVRVSPNGQLFAYLAVDGVEVRRIGTGELVVKRKSNINPITGFVDESSDIHFYGNDWLIIDGGEGHYDLLKISTATGGM